MGLWTHVGAYSAGKASGRRSGGSAPPSAGYGDPGPATPVRWLLVYALAAVTGVLALLAAGLIVLLLVISAGPGTVDTGPTAREQRAADRRERVLERRCDRAEQRWLAARERAREQGRAVPYTYRRPRGC